VGAIRQAIPLPEEPRDEFIAFDFLEGLLFMFQQCAVKNRGLTKQLTGLFQPSGQPDDYLSAEETATRDDLLLRLTHARTAGMVALKSDKALWITLLAKLKTLPPPVKPTRTKVEGDTKTEDAPAEGIPTPADPAAAALAAEKLAEREVVQTQLNVLRDMATVYPSVFLLAGNLLNSPPTFAFGGRASCSWRNNNDGKKKSSQQKKKKQKQTGKGDAGGKKKGGGQQQKKRKQPATTTNNNNNNGGRKKNSAKKQKNK
jgi:hypothetical protein